MRINKQMNQVAQLMRNTEFLRYNLKTKQKSMSNHGIDQFQRLCFYLEEKSRVCSEKETSFREKFAF